jgi:nucleoside-diphosphate-sugar epimerase
MARVLVTGATGFIGSKLTARLVERGDEVTCLVRATSKTGPLEALGVRLAQGDVRSPRRVRAAVAGADVVYHLAGLVTAFRQSDLHAVNTEGFRNVAAACAARITPPTLVSISSLAAAGPAPADRPRVESDPARPVSHYGRAKRAAELIAADYSSRVPITIVRPPIVFGEGDVAMRDVFRSIFRFGVHLALGVAPNRYSLIHVRDLVDAMILCGERGSRLDACAQCAAHSPRGYYFVAMDDQPTFADLGRLIGQCFGRQRFRIMSSSGPSLLWLAAALAEVGARVRGTPYILNFDRAREALAGDWTCSAQAIRHDLGFTPQVPFVDRLRQTSDWYLRHGWL